MKCLKCGQDNDPDVSWCVKCLTEIPSKQPRYLLCPECRHKNDPTAYHCEICHEPLRTGQAE